ncbi:hypothetical protein C3747_26g216 [Trypanosoma cruzi]|uniref:Leucine-rich repeat protein (LRRP) n=2 Tax=Trypanosoma cruzi TaxID=5693 RepID=Q4D8E0_TRYCC|nr:hypothetical protein, conserved [Trypanosoma cruzi]EAN88793.1 hypothetical protein, conserved [Trypanosoma cruzi]PWV15965.1 hypothetical protein C3747_26g216 [Trypanosoma cruzi]RNC53294.1 hypothetical protein TcCL_ESM09389 [Trypanosoma cruzi]|eukprot:XP_810644.1 hypothetical protein [Trypanosoma cruzi strain CL Brener]
MGVGQSRELLGKVSDERVFICTNREELIALLANLQKTLPPETDEGGVDEMKDQYPEGEEKEKEGERLDETTDKAAAHVPVEAIHIPNHYLGDDGFLLGHPEVLQSLAASTALHSLDVGYNALTARSAEALVGGPGTPPNLQSLNLAGNHMGPAGCKKIAEFLAKNPPLRELSLFHNGLYDSDVEPILRALSENTHLRFLNLDCNFLTGEFLRVLLEVLQSNTTLAVVWFDGPYHPDTLEPMRPASSVELIPGEEDTSANARFLLRKRLLRADLAGRPPFPANLVRELEVILAPRRAAYLAELKADEEAEARRIATAEAAAAAVQVARRLKDAACLAIGDQQQMADGEEEVCNDAEHPEGQAQDEHTPLDGVVEKAVVEQKGRTALGSSFDPHTSSETGRWRVGFVDGASRSQTSMSAALKGDSHIPTSARRTHTRNVKGGLVSGRELSNGFDRLVLLPTDNNSSTKTIWHKITGPPYRLRACWCDPRDVAMPYGSILHYHCKHEPTGGDMGEIGTNDKPLEHKNPSTRANTRRVLQRILKGSSKESNEGKKVVYNGCKATSHRCESIGFYGSSKPDRSSVFFFASPHPMHAIFAEPALDAR